MTTLPEVEATSATSSGTEAVTASGYSNQTIKCIISEIAPFVAAVEEEATTTPRSAIGNGAYGGNAVIR